MLSVSISTVVADPADHGFFSVDTNNTELEQTPNQDWDAFYATGLLIPEHLVNSEYVVGSNENIIASTYPARWDWREKNGVTPVKNQQRCGSCYSFGTIGMIEHVIKANTGITYDLSEEQAKNCVWQDRGCKGGTVLWNINLFTQHGIMTEADFPYHPENGLCSAIEPTLRITDWKLISTEEVPNKNILQRYIMEYGAVVTSLVVEDWALNYNGSYVLDQGEGTKNHCVVLVGWNDSIGDNNVSGHWIFKNSWGTSWGDNGYGYIAYENNTIGRHASVISDYEDYKPYESTLNYDEAGWTEAIGALGNDRIKGLCKYNVSDKNVTGIEFWTTGSTSDIDLYLYDGFDGVNLGNELFSMKNLYYVEPGYHSVSFDEVHSPTGVIAVVAEITNIDCVYFDDKVAVIPIDTDGKMESGKTYVGVGNPDSQWYGLWYDMSTLLLGDGTTLGGDVAIRLRVIGADERYCTHILLNTDDFSTTAAVGDNVQFVSTCIDNMGCIMNCTNISYTSSNTTVGYMAEDVLVTLIEGLNEDVLVTLQKGKTNVTARYHNIISNNVTITVTESGKLYLTEGEFEERVQELRADLDKLDNETTEYMMNITNVLNNSKVNGGGGGGTNLPDDMVSRDQFNVVIDELQDKINSMRSKSSTLYELILQIIHKIFD